MTSSILATLTSPKMTLAPLEWEEFNGGSSNVVGAACDEDHFASQAVEPGWVWLEASHGWLATEMT